MKKYLISLILMLPYAVCSMQQTNQPSQKIKTSIASTSRRTMINIVGKKRKRPFNDEGKRKLYSSLSPGTQNH